MNWEINNTHFVQYCKKQKKSDNKIWSVNRIYHEKYVSSSKLTRNIGRETSSRSILVFEKALHEIKTRGQIVSFNILR